MTTRQKQLYFREWGLARKALIKAHYEPKEADVRRLEIHAEVIGIEDFDPDDPGHRQAASSKNLTNKNLDGVLAAFRALSDPGNLNAQIKADNQPLKRARVALRKLQHKIGSTNKYVDGIAESMFGIPVEHCNLDQVKAVIAGLNKHRLRGIKFERKRVEELCSDRVDPRGYLESQSIRLFDKKYLHLEASQLVQLHSALCHDAWNEKLVSER